MKKPTPFIALVAVFIIVLSCTPDNVAPHPMVGLWQIQKIFQQGEELPLDDCALLTTSEFRSDGVFLERRFSMRVLGCSLANDNGIWTDTGENRVRIAYDNGNADFQNIKFTIEGSNMTFSDGDGSETFAVILKRID